MSESIVRGARRRGHRENRRRSDRALISLADAATARLGPAEVLERVAAAAATLTGEATVHLWLVGDDGRHLELAAEHGARPGARGVPSRKVLGIGEGLAGKVAETREPIVRGSVRRDPTVANPDWVRDQGLVSFAGVPFARADRLLGVLCVFTWRRHRFARHEVDLLRSFASHAAVAIDSAAVFEASTRRLRRLEALREIEWEISQQRYPETLLGLISRRATELLQADSATVFLFDEATGCLRPRAAFNVEAWIQDVAIPLGEGVAGTTARDRDGMIVNDYPHSAYAIAPFRDLNWAVAAQPLVYGSALQGVIVVNRQARDRPFSQVDLVQLGDFAVQASIALENARVLRLASARAERVKAAAEVGQLLASTLDADRILDLIAEKCREILGAEAFGLFRLDSDQRLRYARGFGLDETFLREHTLALDEGVVGKAARQRCAIVTADILRDPEIALSAEARARIELRGTRAMVGVPILIREESVGALAVYHPPGFRIPAEETEFLETLANHAAVALDNARLFAEARHRQATAETLAVENARLYEEARQRAAEARALFEVSRLVSAVLDPERVLDLIVEKVLELMKVPACGIFRLDAQQVLRYARGAGLSAEFIETLAVPLGQGTSGRSVVERVPVWTSDILADPAIALDPTTRTLVERERYHAVLSVPIEIKGAPFGCVATYWWARHVPTSAEIETLSSLATLGAVALENARLYEEAQRHFEELTRAYQDLKTAQEQLVQTEKLRALGEMASGVAHDFNNALAAILGRVQLVLRRVEDPTVRRWLEIAERSALDAAQTVRRIQEFTRVRRDQPTETVDVGQVVRDAVELTQTRWRDDAQSRGLDVRVVTKFDPVPAVDGHAAELRESLTNLILNAVDALPRGGTISITTRQAADAVEVSVADDGVGMSDAVRRRIFEPFFSTKGPQGTGLGLAMVYGIVSRHGGQVAVDSREGAGSTFTIRLPVGRGGGPSPVAPVVPVADARARVLVIDDEEEVREALADMLRVNNHEVVVATHGAEGVARFREVPFDLVLTDLAMPEMSGWQVALAVKALRPDVPVVLVTGWGVELPAAELKAHGVDRVMAKPFKLEAILDLVASFGRD
ncbi:MAG: GAF domain-containing protein [Candidatus Rokuibacteriota bacterium]